MIRCLIIEDNKNTVEIIKTVGNDFSKIFFNEINEDQEVALNTILKIKPEIVIINIESTKINFLEFLFDINQYSENKPNFIGLSTSKDKAFDSYKYDFIF